MSKTLPRTPIAGTVFIRYSKQVESNCFPLLTPLQGYDQYPLLGKVHELRFRSRHIEMTNLLKIKTLYQKLYVTVCMKMKNH